MDERMTEVAQSLVQPWQQWQGQSVSWLENLTKRQFECVQGYQSLWFKRLQALSEVEGSEWWMQLPQWQVETWEALSQQTLQDVAQWEELSKQLSGDFPEVPSVAVMESWRKASEEMAATTAKEVKDAVAKVTPEKPSAGEQAQAESAASAKTSTTQSAQAAEAGSSAGKESGTTRKSSRRSTSSRRK